MDSDDIKHGTGVDDDELIHSCVSCIKLRGKPVDQKMADLPVERITPSPPFTHVGCDTFGPFFLLNKDAAKSKDG